MEWRAHVQGLAPGLVEHVKEVAGQIKTDAPEAVDKAIETWFESDQSLNQLLEQELHPIFAAMHGRLVREAEETMKRRASEDLAGLASAADVLADLANVGVAIRATADAALVHLKAGAATISPQPQLASNIPVRRSFADWLLLRSETTVRQRLFGPAERPDTEIPAASKARLLGQRGREALQQVLLARLVSLLDEAASGVPDQLVQGYAERFEEALLSLLERAQQEANQRLDAHEQRLRKVQQANDSVKELVAVLPSFSLSVDMLTDQFGQNGEAPLAEHAFEELE
jgi:hypothetical protein